MAKLVASFDVDDPSDFPLLDNQISKEEMYKKGRELLVERGYTPDMLDDLDDDDFINVYAENELHEGRARMKLTSSVILESGEKAVNTVYAYVFERYKDAVIREAKEHDMLNETFDI